MIGCRKVLMHALAASCEELRARNGKLPLWAFNNGSRCALAIVNALQKLINNSRSNYPILIIIPAKEHFNKRPLLCKLYKYFYIKIFI